MINISKCLIKYLFNSRLIYSFGDMLCLKQKWSIANILSLLLHLVDKVKRLASLNNTAMTTNYRNAEVNVSK